MSGVNARSDVQHWYGNAELSEKVSCEAMKLNGFFLYYVAVTVHLMVQ